MFKVACDLQKVPPKSLIAPHWWLDEVSRRMRLKWPDLKVAPVDEEEKQIAQPAKEDSFHELKPEDEIDN